MNKILVELEPLEANCLVACARNFPKKMDAETAATIATAVEGAEVLEAALNYVPAEMRRYSQEGFSYRSGTHTELTVDSGWDKNAVKLDFSTPRGRTVSMNVNEWRNFVSKVENIIAWCEYRREQDAKKTAS